MSDDPELGASDGSEQGGGVDAPMVHGAAAAASTTAGVQQSHRLSEILIGVTTILAVLAIFTVGGRTQVLDTDEWATLSTDILQEPEVQDAVAEHVVDVLDTELDLGAGIADLLSEDIEGVGGPLIGALRDPLTEGVVRLLGSEAFQTLWESSTRIAHSTMVAILRDQTPEGISSADGQVTLQLDGLVLAVGEALGLPESLLDELPEDAGNIVVFESGELESVQTLVETLDFLAWFLFTLVIVLYALSVYLARGHRMAALRRVGWSLFGVGVVVLIARTIAVRALVNSIVEDVASRPAAEEALSVGTALLRQMGWSTLIYGVLIVAFTSLLGDGPWARSSRRMLAPAMNASTGAVVAGTGLFLIVLIWWQPGRAFEGWVTASTLVGLVIGAVVTLRAKTLRDFPT